MKLYLEYLILIFISLILTACPYKKIYNNISDGIFEVYDGIYVSPKNIYHHGKGDTAFWNISLEFVNKTTSLKKLDISKTLLFSKPDTIIINSVFILGNMEKANELVVKKEIKEELGLIFRDKKKKGEFPDTLILQLFIGNASTKFYFKRL
ncbi:MAG TPA: hypothetical protein PKC62_07840 [Ferruginibacter sp.]|nr:hypothetical protein [Bacteroidota bacterium]MCC6693700.1 hypothetical protein [Chitinophagaceae bacterium]HMT96585.1 hypothetical protein [Ferruginibacter sp.]HMU24209.1 hypothetical protein [Ferruginibacter sp.]